MQKRPDGVPENYQFIPFMEWIRPHGHTRDSGTWQPVAVQRKAIACITAGARFELESMPFGQIVLYCTFRGKTIHTIIIYNEKETHDRIKELIDKASDTILKVLEEEKSVVNSEQALRIFKEKSDEA